MKKKTPNRKNRQALNRQSTVCTSSRTLILVHFCGQLTFVRKILALFMYGAGFQRMEVLL